MLGPLSVSIKFVLPRPKARKHDTWVSVRPDIDNYIKAILDSLNEIVWQDDGQVAELYASKKYETKECGPRIVVTVTSL